MKWSPKIDKAIEISAKQHWGQLRKNGVTPYIVHPFTVAWMVSEYTEKEDTIIAALLHDVIEDTPNYKVNDIRRDFGENVSTMVAALSKNVDIKSDGLSWLEVKEQHLNKLKEAGQEVLLIAIMDHIHNATTMVEEIKENGHGFWENFNGKKTEKYEWEMMNWRLFSERNLPEKLCHKLRQLIAELYETELIR